MAVSEYKKIEIRSVLERFLNDQDTIEFEFPPELTNVERALIHRQCQQLGLHSKTRGGGDRRYLTIFKQRKLNEIGRGDVQSIPEINTGDQELSNAIQAFLKRKPIKEADLENLRTQGLYQPNTVMPQPSGLMLNEPRIPSRPKWDHVSAEVLAAKRGLPIQNSRGDFMQMLQFGQVILVIGETGSGKSTQVPQFILEEAARQNCACRIIVAEPRRIAATTLAERVAFERGEKIGDVVGYQIRLESRASSRTITTFCTNGVLLKTIISDPGFFSSITHLIIDEIHERDKFTDFLLIILRDVLPLHPNLRLILMSASLERELLEAYFGNATVLTVPGRVNVVDNFFLSDVLFMTGYVSWLLRQRRQQERPDNLHTVLMGGIQTSSFVERPSCTVYSTHQSDASSLDTFLENTWRLCDKRALVHMIDLIVAGDGDVNYQHSHNGATLLMIAAGLGFDDVVGRLLNTHNANPALATTNGWQALHWAFSFGNDECIELLDGRSSTEAIVDVYHSMMDDDQIDIGLLTEMLAFICKQLPPGGVLVFLPGYDDMMQTKEAIRRDLRFTRLRIFVCMLHSQMRGQEQRKAFEPAYDGYRKIVLATNIAEVSITLEDMCYVVDTGKMKQRGYDAVNDVNAISTTWISKANVIQRTGRAGRCRPGVCFHLYSELRYNSMPDAPIPEILRVPIHEICLQAKLLKPDLKSVAEFLRKAPNPPSDSLVFNSIDLLKGIGAFDADERITVLGRCLSELPVDPQIGKIILYGVLLRCLDPVLTIAAALSYGDPFLLPRERDQSEKASERRFQLGRAYPYSDHGVLLNAFVLWQRARQARTERTFSTSNYLSNAAMDMITGIKGILLRALQMLGFGSGMASHEDFIKIFNTYSWRWPVVKAALTAGTYPNIAIIDRVNGKLTTKSESAYFNAPSVLLRCGGGSRHTRELRSQALDAVPYDLVIYNDMFRQNYTMQAKCITAVNAVTVALFAGPCILPRTNVTAAQIVTTENESWDLENNGITIHDISVLRIDDWIKVRMENEMVDAFMMLREKLHASFLRQLANPNAAIMLDDKDTLELTVNLICQSEAKE